MTESPLGSPVADVLIVDDTPANLQVLAGMLKEQGFRVHPVPSGRLALRAAGGDPPDLILLDVMMPDMDGYEVCTALKQDPSLRDIPVIFISALNETTDKVRALDVGGVDYITKPFQFESACGGSRHCGALQVELYEANCRRRRPTAASKPARQLTHTSSTIWDPVDLHHHRWSPGRRGPTTSSGDADMAIQGGSAIMINDLLM